MAHVVAVVEGQGGAVEGEDGTGPVTMFGTYASLGVLAEAFESGRSAL
ncbi:hypothetical protein ABZV34_35480 [Streptomyces sp. NPDC005195]